MMADFSSLAPRWQPHQRQQEHFTGLAFSMRPFSRPITIQALLEADVYIDHACEGGICGACCVYPGVMTSGSVFRQLKARRKELDYTSLQTLVELSGVSVSMISRTERRYSNRVFVIHAPFVSTSSRLLMVLKGVVMILLIIAYIFSALCYAQLRKEYGMNTIPTQRLLGGLLALGLMAYAGAGIAASNTTQHIVIDSGDTARSQEAARQSQEMECYSYTA